MTWSIADYGLTAEQLAVKYEKRGYHPEYNGYAYLTESDVPYWSWVVLQLQQEQDELDQDNPYN